MKVFRSYSSRETQKIAKELANDVYSLSTSKGHKRAFIIALMGDLGAGKTTFVQGFLRGLGVRGKITSPTFVIMKRYSLPAFSLVTQRGVRGGSYQTVFHLDLYRIKKSSDLKPLNFSAILKSPTIVLIEWPENIRGLINKSDMVIRFEHVAKEHERVLTVASCSLV